MWSSLDPRSARPIWESLAEMHQLVLDRLVIEFWKISKGLKNRCLPCWSSPGRWRVAYARRPSTETSSDFWLSTDWRPSARTRPPRRGSCLRSSSVWTRTADSPSPLGTASAGRLAARRRKWFACLSSRSSRFRCTRSSWFGRRSYWAASIYLY